MIRARACRAHRPRRRPRGGLAAVLLLSGCAWVSGPRSSDMPLCPDTPEQRIVDLVNRAREGEGLEPLVVDLRLVEAARAHAEDMARHDFSGHEGSDGSLPAERVDRVEYPWTFVAENTAGGLATAAATFAGWMSSTSHRANNLSAEARHLGVGFAEDPETDYGTFWVVLFADADAPPRTTVDRCHP